MEQQQRPRWGTLADYLTAESFQALIASRKAECREEAEKRRQTDSRRIRRLRSSKGKVPDAIFPNEVWDLILEKLDDPQALGNMAKVHPIFHDLIERRDRHIRDIGFPQALEVLLKSGWYLNRNEDYYFSGLRGLQAICKSAKRMIDHQAEEDFLKDMRKKRGNYSFEKNFIFLQSDPYSARTWEVLDKIIFDFPGPVGAASPAKYVKIYIPTRGRSSFRDIRPFTTRFLYRITTALQTIGEGVWYFELQTDLVYLEKKFEITHQQIYTFLQEWTSYMPNLKWLRVYSTSHCRSRLLPIRTPDLIYLGEKYAPFTKLKHLERVSFRMTRYRPPIYELCQMILNTNRHIKILELDGPSDYYEMVPAIQELKLDFFIYEYRARAFHIFNRSWPLTKISLHDYASSKKCLSLRDAFKILRFFPALEDVSLSLQLKKFDQSVPFLSLPNLTKFRIDVSVQNIDYIFNVYAFFSLQFLLYCKRLEELSFMFMYLTLNSKHKEKFLRYMKARERCEESINFRGGMRDLRTSNVWQVFPRLKTIDTYEMFDYEGFPVTHKRPDSSLC